MVTMASPNIKIDTLFNSLKELQKEKACLEQKLKELRQQRSSLEHISEAHTIKQTQVCDMNLKMGETLKLARHKESQTQGQLNNLEEQTDHKRAQVTHMNQQIDGEKQEQAKENLQMQDKLTDLADKFLSAKQFYGKQNLEQELTGMEVGSHDLNEEAEKNERDVVGLQHQLEQLNIDRDSTEAKANELEIQPEVQHLMVTMFAEETKMAENTLQTLDQQTADMRQL